MPLEDSIVKGILKWLNSLPKCKAEKTHGGRFGKAGKPDITGCIRGLRFEIECKRPGEVSTPIQLHEQKLWRDAGAYVMEAHSKQEVIDQFAEWGLIEPPMTKRKSEGLF